MLNVAALTIEYTDLYEIVCGCYIKEDERVICTDDLCAVTGKALRELLMEHADDDQITAVSVCRQSIAELRLSLVDQREGRIRNLFNPVPREQIVTALAHLEREDVRIHDAG